MTILKKTILSITLLTVIIAPSSTLYAQKRDSVGLAHVFEKDEQEMRIDTIDAIILIAATLALTSVIGYLLYRQYHVTSAAKMELSETKDRATATTQDNNNKDVQTKLNEAKQKIDAANKNGRLPDFARGLGKHGRRR